MDSSILRLIDANFNRAREALRVLEDCARFILNDTLLTETAKNLRHDLSQLIAQLPTDFLLAARDTPADVGTTLTAPAEKQRSDTLAVVQAAAKRLSEALRCLEEYSKIDHPDLAARLESIRYRAYELEKQILSRTSRTDRFAPVRLYVLLTEKYCKLPLLETAQAVLNGGADCIQLREKDKPDSELLPLARDLAQLCHEHHALFFMNDRPDLALLAGADGLHLGRHDLPVNAARKILPAHLLIGTSTHNLEEARTALEQNPDYLAVGSIFPSPTKPDVPTAGLDLIKKIRPLTTLPLVAIGGINADNASSTLTAGAHAVALCQAIISTDDPAAATQKIIAQLQTNLS
jgi:thiamine-phosphate pyrophosphorylase